MQKHDPYHQRSIIIFTLLSLLITIVDGALIIFFPVFLTQCLVLNVFFVVFAVFLLLSRFGKLTLGQLQKPSHSNLKWLAMIIGIECFSVFLFANFLQASKLFLHNDILPLAIQYPSAHSMLKMHLYDWGLFPWSLIAVFAAGLGYVFYQNQQSATISNLTGNLQKTYYDTFIKRVSNSSIGAISNFMVIIAIAIGTLAAGKLILNALGIHDSLHIRLGSFIFFALASIITTFKLNHIVCQKICKYSRNDGLAILAYCLVIMAVFVACYVFADNILNFATHYLTISDLSSLHFKNHLILRWPLFFWGWWICATPLIASAIARVSKGRSMRSVILATLLLPAIISICLASPLSFSFVDTVGTHLLNTTWLAFIGPLCLIGVFMKIRGAKLLVFGFMPKDEESIVTKTVKPIQFLRSTLAVIPLFMAIFLIRNLFGIQFLVLLAAIPNMIYFMIVCLLFYKKLLLQKQHRITNMYKKPY